MPREEGIEHDRDAPRLPPREPLANSRAFQMNPRLLLSVALIAVLLCFWLVMTKPMCRDGFAASLGAHSGWTCVADAP
jgi:hypothetical protein